MFPPQVYLLQLLAAPSFFGCVGTSVEVTQLKQQRDRFNRFLQHKDKIRQPKWSEVCISPEMIQKRQSDGRTVLGLSKPGWELSETKRMGDDGRAILVDFRKEGPRRVEVGWRDEVLLEESRWRKKNLQARDAKM